MSAVRRFGALIVCSYALAVSGIAASQDSQLTLIPLPRKARVCVMGHDYEMPYTRRGMQERIRARKHLYRQNEEQGVLLSRGQVIGVSTEDSGDLSFLKEVPAERLRDLRLTAPAISDDGIKQLSRFHGLTHFGLSLDRVDNIDKIIAATPRLVQFSLGSPSIPTPLSEKHFFTDKRFKLFAELPQLKSVHVFSPLVSDEALRLAAKIPKLEVLSIRVEGADISAPRRITDEGLKALANAKHLREVVLEVGPKCTDEGVKELLRLERLEWIEIHGMAQVDQATVDALKTQFPDAHIEFKPRAAR